MLSVPPREFRGAIAAAIILLLVFAGSVQAEWEADMGKNYNNLLKNKPKISGKQTSGNNQWNTSANQIDGIFSQMRRDAQGVPGAMHYVNMAEKYWNQAKSEWARQQYYQQQNTMNQTKTQLLTQQQYLKDQLMKQQQFLKQQLEYLKSPQKKKINEDSVQHLGQVLQPDMNAKGGPFMAGWEEAKRELASISNVSSPYSTTKNKKELSNPYANDPNVVDLRDAKTLTPKSLKGGSYDNPFARDASMGVVDPRDLKKYDPKSPMLLSKQSSKVDISMVKGVDQKLRQDLLGNFSETISKNANQRDDQVQNLVKSFETGKPVSNQVKDMAKLVPGDVILVDKIPPDFSKIKDGDWEHIKDSGISNIINFLDRTGSDKVSSNASHTASFLGERNGKRWYLDNTSEAGPVIIEEKVFLKKYEGRNMDAATYVGQPLTQEQGELLWKGAHELRDKFHTNYGPSRVDRNNPLSVDPSTNPKMVCSESSRWLLVRAGRNVPETQNANLKIKGIDTGLNKKQVVTFSPADFYKQHEYFLIQPLGLKNGK